MDNATNNKCRWFLRCSNPATTTVAHPVLGQVPACERCAKLAGKKRKCWYSGHVILDMEFANFTRAEVRAYERRNGGESEAQQCHGCGAMRKPQWVKRSLGGPGSGAWQWSLIYPHHHAVARVVEALAVGDRVEGGEGEGHDTGRILEIEGDMATVAWDSGVRTPTPISILKREVAQ